MQIYRHTTLARFAAIGPLEFEGIGATDAMCDDHYSLWMPGGDISRLKSGKANLLSDHRDVIGVILSARTTRSELLFRARFATPGVSALADEKRKLVKDGILGSLSLSFSVQESKAVSGGRIATKWTALEISLCAVPMDASAVVTARSLRVGKTLSSVNAEMLRTAHDHADRAHTEAENCRQLVHAVLAAAELDADDDGARTADYERRRWLKRKARARELAAAACPLSQDFLRRQARKLEVNGRAAGRPLTREFRQRQAKKWARNVPDVAESAPPARSRAERQARARELATPRY